MSDFLDIIKSAADKGILLDSCGSDERQYWWGLYNDLCGMSVEDALACQYYHGDGGGDTPKKKSNTINFLMQKGSGGEYTLYLVSTYAPTAPVFVSFTFDGQQQTVTFPAGSTSFDTNLKGETPTKPYAEISNIATSSEDETYTYTGKNSVETGIFTLTINNDGEITVDHVKYNTTVILPEAPAKEGYTFSWKTSGGEVITETSFPMPEKDLSIIGEYVVSTFQLSYTVWEEYLDNGSLPKREYAQATVSIPFGKKVLDYIKAAAPAREGYTLSAWQTDAGTEITPSYTMPASNLSAETTYSLNKYTLTFKVDSEIYNEHEYYFGETVAAVEDPSKTGYVFDGWDKTVPTTMPASNLTINAVFTAIDYHIYYIIDGATAYTETHHYGDAITIRSDETREGYTFSGWNPSVLPATRPTEDITVQGTFSINSYTITYFVDGVQYSAETYNYGAAVVAIAEPTREGYTFGGWIGVPATMPAGDVTVNGTFTINTYTLAYLVDGESYSSQTYEYGAAVVAIAEPTREGYTFGGWVDVPATMPASNVTVEGTFTAIDYNFTCVVDGATVVERVYHFGDTIAPVDEPTKEGYTFTGWSPAIPATMPSHDVECIAGFEINSYTITYLVDGVSAYTEEHEFGSAISIREDETREGYTFSGWNPSELPATMPANDITVQGTFTINTYSIVYYVDGVEFSAETYDFGAAITAVEEPTREGYTFSGWDNVPATMPAHDVEVRGTFAINTYTLTYFVDNVEYSAETYEYGAAITAIEEPTREGYTFGGWQNVPATMPARDVEVYGVFTVNVHTLTYLVDGEPYSAVSVAYGTTIVPIEAPAKTGYTFTEWANLPATMPDDDVTVEAVYTVNTWTAFYEIRSGETTTPFTSISFDYGATIVDPVPPAKTGYTFAWDSHVATMPDNDIVIIGEYTEAAQSTIVYHNMLQYDITSAITAEIMSASTSYDGGEEVEKLVNPTIEASEQCLEWARLRDEELDAYDEDGEEYHVDAADEYQALIDNYAASPESRYGFVFAIPASLALTHLLGSIGEEKTVETLNTITIDGTNYTVYRYAPDNNAFHQCAIQLVHTFTIIVE